MKVWKCEIGRLDDFPLEHGADYPMRVAIQIAYKMVTGKDPEFCFSGWGGRVI
jgi:hypothetical protein